MSGESGAYAAPPSRVPIALHAPFLQHFLRAGAYYPRGPARCWRRDWARSWRAYGGRVRTGAAVRRILVEGGRAAGVRMADGSTHDAKVVISNADLRRTLLDLVGPST